MQQPRTLAPPQSTPQRRGGEITVTVSIPLVVLLGVVVFIAWRFMGLRVWHAVMCLLFGFFLAATSTAPEIRRVVTAIVRSLDH
jgi:Na+/glutamate symporter